MNVVILMPIHTRPFATWLTILEALRLRDELMEVGYGCQIKIFGSKNNDIIVKRKIESMDMGSELEFIETANGSMPKGVALKMSNILKFFYENKMYTHGVWFDSNNWFSSKYREKMVDAIINDIPFWGAQAYTMFKADAEEGRKFRRLVFKNTQGHHCIGPGKGWTREAFDSSFEPIYIDTGFFVNKAVFKCPKGLGNDTDFAFIMKRGGFPLEPLSDDYLDVIDFKTFNDINQIDKYTDTKPYFDPPQSFIDEMLSPIVEDYGKGLKLPIKLRDKVSSLLS